MLCCASLIMKTNANYLYMKKDIMSLSKINHQRQRCVFKIRVSCIDYRGLRGFFFLPENTSGLLIWVNWGRIFFLSIILMIYST